MLLKQKLSEGSHVLLVEEYGLKSSSKLSLRDRVDVSRQLGLQHESFVEQTQFLFVAQTCRHV